MMRVCGVFVLLLLGVANAASLEDDGSGEGSGQVTDPPTKVPTKLPTKASTIKTDPPTTVAPTQGPTVLMDADICTFENGQCGWQIPNDDYTFKREVTGERTVGPLEDHTLNSRLGHDMRVDLKGWKGTAQLVKEFVSSSPNVCVDFAYSVAAYLAARRIELEVEITTANTSTTQKVDTVGTYVWSETRVPIVVKPKEKFEVKLKVYTTAYVSYGFFSIDDVEIKPNCPSIPTTTTPKPILPFSFKNPDCDFETSTCGWVDHSDNDFDWLRHVGGTPSQVTGPDGDHTLGSNGHYMYTEASNPQQYGDITVLVSPEIQPSKDQSCFEMWYHMYGSGMGTLEVDYLDKNRTIGLFSKSGSHGFYWQKAVIPLPPQIGSFRLVIRGTVGTSYSSDIAIDDLKLNSSCNMKYTTTPEPTTTTTTPKPTVPSFSFMSPNCSFEDMDKPLCGWKHHGSNDFDWIRESGRTLSQNTGPSADHTLGNINGHYVYIEASSPRVLGDYAALVSPELLPPTDNAGNVVKNQSICFEMFYHMFGGGVGNITVEYLVANTSKKMFMMSGDQGNRWKNVSIPLPMLDQPFKLLISAVRGNDYDGDIAIDDLTLNTNCTTAMLVRALNKPETTSQLKQLQDRINALQKELTTLTGHQTNILQIVEGFKGVLTVPGISGLTDN